MSARIPADLHVRFLWTCECACRRQSYRMAKHESEENRKKNEYAVAHFERVNQHLKAAGDAIRYKFNFLTETSFNKFFQSLRDGTIGHFRSELDVKLVEEQ